MVGETKKKISIIKFDNTESLTSGQSDWDLVLLKELAVQSDEV